MDDVVTARMSAPAPEWRAALRPTLRNRLVVFGAILVLALITLAVFARAIAPYDPTEMKVADALKAPSWRPSIRDRPLRPRRAEPDDLRQPHRARRGHLQHRAWPSPWARCSASSAATSGLGGPGDRADHGHLVQLSRPSFWPSASPPCSAPGSTTRSLAIAVVYAPLFSRVARGSVIAERAKDHVVAALGLGAGCPRIVFRHILPNIRGAPHRPGLGEPRLRHPHRGLLELPRSGHPAAGSLVGHDAERRAARTSRRRRG